MCLFLASAEGPVSGESGQTEAAAVRGRAPHPRGPTGGGGQVPR